MIKLSIKLNKVLFICIVILLFGSCKKNATSSQNTSPIASFTINPTSGTTATTFTFDASGSSDNEDATSALQVRWDWENDGTYDTDYTTTKTATHQYVSAETFTIKLEVLDSGGLSTSTTKEVIVSIEPVTDIDGNIYNTIQIGNQEWMAENLKVTRYRNGDVIQNVTDNTTQWTNLTTGAYCSYANNDSYIGTYGLLYNWYAVDDSRGLAPEGWHIPSDEEWKQLEMYLGMSQNEADSDGFRYSNVVCKLKDTSGWASPNTCATNESGFSALPGGFRDGVDGTFGYASEIAYFWTATEHSSDRAWGRLLFHDQTFVWRFNPNMADGYSVRCIRD